MSRESFLKALGLSQSSSPEEIAQNINKKKITLENKVKSAPTEALRDKYLKMLEQLAVAEKALLNDQKPADVPAATPALSKTKIQDLPQSSESFTQYDGEQGHAIALVREGEVLVDRYEVRQCIGAGGMGAVFRAYDRNRNSEIAVKLLLPALIDSDRAKERFLTEAKVSSELSHPNIVNVYDVQQSGNHSFITMELLEGQDLRTYLKSHRDLRHPIEAQDAVDIIVALAGALEHAHKMTIHRDIKPENIWLTDDGAVKLMDFGIARLMSTTQVTRTGLAMGTAYYMAPEQMKGRGDIDGRADQYALAVVAYELLAGEVPMGRVEPLSQVRSDVPKYISRAIDKAMSVKPEDRYPDINEFAKALQSPKSFYLPAIDFRDNKPLLAGAGAVVIVLTIAIGMNDGVMNSIKSILPKSEAELQAEREATEALVYELSGEVKRLAETLKRNITTLDASVKGSEREGGDVYKFLRERQLLVQQHIDESESFTELYGKTSKAESFMRNKNYPKAEKLLREIKGDYLSFIDKYDDIERAILSKSSFVSTYQEARRFLEDNRLNWAVGWGYVERMKEKGGQLLIKGAFEASSIVYDDAAKYSQKSIADIKDLMAVTSTQ